MLKKKIWANFQRITELFTQKIVTKLSKIWAWDPRSGIRKKPIPDPGVKKAPDPVSRIRNSDPDPDPAQNLDADPDPDPDPGGEGAEQSSCKTKSVPVLVTCI